LIVLIAQLLQILRDAGYNNSARSIQTGRFYCSNMTFMTYILSVIYSRFIPVSLLMPFVDRFLRLLYSRLR